MTTKPLAEAGQPLQVPASTSPARLAAHAQRIADLAHAVTTTRWTTTAQASRLLLVGHALSTAVDLRTTVPNTRNIAYVAFPLREDPRGEFWWTLRSDIPRYAPPTVYGRCPIRGPRGGECRSTGAMPVRHITNPDTGEWSWVHACAKHAEVVRHAHEIAGACQPAPNCGGILAYVFGEIDMDALYRRATPLREQLGQWRPTPRPAGGRPLLRIVTDDAPNGGRIG